jgi:hypothetical protein
MVMMASMMLTLRLTQGCIQGKSASFVRWRARRRQVAAVDAASGRLMAGLPTMQSARC